VEGQREGKEGRRERRERDRDKYGTNVRTETKQARR
jgi:hypothetical protein